MVEEYAPAHGITRNTKTMVTTTKVAVNKSITQSSFRCLYPGPAITFDTDLKQVFLYGGVKENDSNLEVKPQIFRLCHDIYL